MVEGSHGLCYTTTVNVTRQQQLLSHIKRLVSEQLHTQDHELFHDAVVTDVLLSNDGKLARIWIDGDDVTLELLNSRYHNGIQRGFLKKFSRKIVPTLIFMKETGEITAMDKLLDEERTKL